MTEAMGVESQNLFTQLTMSSLKILPLVCFRVVCFVFVHGFLKLLPMVFYGVGLSHGIGISLNILLIVPTVVVVPLMVVMNFQMGEDKVY